MRHETISIMYFVRLIALFYIKTDSNFELINENISGLQIKGSYLY